MLSVMQTALRGLQRNQAGFQVAANNIANVNTDGYRAQRLDPASGRVTTVSDPNTSPRADTHPYADVDLATEIVNMKAYEIGVKANAKLIAIADRLLGELLDTFA